MITLRSPRTLGILVGALGTIVACGQVPASADAAGAGGQTESGSGSATGGHADTSSGGAGGGDSAGGGASGGTLAASGGVPGDSGGTGSGGSNSASGGNAAGGAPNEGGWRPVWSDEFDAAEIDPGNWEHEVNCWGGGNGEDQCYVADAKNSYVEDGVLHIVAIKDAPSGPEGGGSGNTGIVSKGHSSARLRTKGLADFKYGRIEARLRLPFGQGLWPAFWMLPTDETYGGWASSGEIDIMEAVNLNPSTAVHGTLHYGGAWPDNTNSGTSTTPPSNPWENFHLYAVEWEEGEVRWFVDDDHYLTQTEWFSSAAPYPAPFDQEFHILLNVAVGGSWPGPPDSSTTFPQEMLVDFVRVFACAADPETGRGCSPE